MCRGTGAGLRCGSLMGPGEKGSDQLYVSSKGTGLELYVYYIYVYIFNLIVISVYIYIYIYRPALHKGGFISCGLNAFDLFKFENVLPC